MIRTENRRPPIALIQSEITDYFALESELEKIEPGFRAMLRSRLDKLIVFFLIIGFALQDTVGKKALEAVVDSHPWR